MREEDDYTDDRGRDGSEEDGGGAGVLGVAEAWALFLGDFVGEKFEGGVESFGGPDESDGEDEGGPFPVNEGEAEAEGNDGDRGGEMDPRRCAGCG